MFIPESIALKEWAVTTKALQEGAQIIMMRKGGIVEETRHFEVRSHTFYLYPTYEHQKKEWIKESHRLEIDETLVNWDQTGQTVTVSACAKVVESIEITDTEDLIRIADFHIGTDAFAEERLKWKRKQPLHLLVLRVYMLENPVTLPVVPEYLGCKSWVRLEQDRMEAAGPLSPVLNDTEFEKEHLRLKHALAT
ncbi:hypothetical protein SY83_21755 [Paenibacillus swuensis]|uniref:DUF1802 domain-containing protein n=2 Tax=Paenibacillus swuensis TaxID=1178515 RepID=A0A172TN42_9BACL|nr:hypothetical protein SY83_21755 [Paenibacillus swuensis]